MGVLSETKHFQAGSEVPATRPGVLRVYSMKFCPYAERTRLVLAHKGIDHEVININLQSKPEWFLQRNPLGMVPVLEIDDKVIYESPICNEWLDEVYPEQKLGPSDAYAKAQWKMLAERFTKVTAAYYKVIFAKTDADKEQGVKDLKVALGVLEEALTKPFFGGNDLALVDFHFWPWFERVGLLRKHGFELISEEFPRLHSWIGRMLEVPAVQTVRLDENWHDAFYKTYLAGAADYDLTL